MWLGFAYCKVDNTFPHLPLQMVVKFRYLAYKDIEQGREGVV